MTRRLTVSLLLMVLLGLVAVAPVAADQSFTCADQSCAYTVPDSYTITSNEATQVIFSDSVSGGVFSVAANDATGISSLDDAVNAIDAQNTVKNGYQAGPDNRKSTILGGNPAILLEYMSINKNGIQVETANFITLYQGKQYQLIFVTTPDNEDAFVAGAKSIFDSWQFT